MASKRQESGKVRFSHIIKEVCDEEGLKYNQIKPLVYKIMTRLAIYLISGKSITILGFGSIVTSWKVIKRKSFVLKAHDGRVYETPCVPKLNFKLSLDKKIDPKKNYQSLLNFIYYVREN
jgi:nucleoid DNA-binding protein